MNTTKTNNIFPELSNYIKDLINDFDQISSERKVLLSKLSAFIANKVKNNLPVRLIFICTHNSRRSHLSQIWAQTAAYFYGITGVESFSGGTEATAFNPRAVKAMQKAGFKITFSDNSNNPLYTVEFAEGQSIKAFSKKYDAEENPSEDFCAIMTCSHADENCPFIPGASLRLPISYDDPKDFDGTPLEETKYNERCRQIGVEMFYAFSLINN
ncbi:MAG TPA: protein-tyrosine-phosphatase [Cytophagales bacterium]|nr:protein-tyrosine-phosphatase [Cytophagales bacterium]